MIATLASAILSVRQFHRGELSAVELEKVLLDEGWTDVVFQKKHVWARYLGLPYLLED